MKKGRSEEVMESRSEESMERIRVGSVTVEYRCFFIPSLFAFITPLLPAFITSFRGMVLVINDKREKIYAPF